jgi:hypothetical protein
MKQKVAAEWFPEPAAMGSEPGMHLFSSALQSISFAH